MPSTARDDVVVACPSLALDRTLLVDRLLPGDVHRPLRVDVRGGGKGGNVARVLAGLGASVHLVGIVGPPDDPQTEFVVRSLQRAGIRVSPVYGSAMRTCTTVASESADSVTSFYESAASCGPDGWANFAAAARAAAGSGAVVVFTGSLPPDVPTAQLAELAWTAITLSTAVVCDLAGAALTAVLGSRPDVVTPNAAEAAEALGLASGSPDQGLPTDLARRLVAAGARAAVVTAGSAGVDVAAGDAVAPRRVVAPTVRVRNPTGAGDVLTAALALALHGGRSVTASAAQAVRLASESCTTFAAADLPLLQEAATWQR